MRRLKQAAFSVLLLMATDLLAFDAPPPPEPKTLEWTVGVAAFVYPMFDMEDTKVSKIIAWLDDSEQEPGFYLSIDTSRVSDRLDKTMTFVEKNATWLKLLGKVVDAIDADIEIRPGRFALVPREPAGGAMKDADGQRKPVEVR